MQQEKMNLWQRMMAIDCGCDKRRAKIMAYIGRAMTDWKYDLGDKYLAYYDRQTPSRQKKLQFIDWILGIVVYAMMWLGRYILNILISLDQLLNVVVFLGDPDETMSSRFSKWEAGGVKFGYYMCRCLHWFDRDHCRKSTELDEGSRGMWEPEMVVPVKDKEPKAEDKASVGINDSGSVDVKAAIEGEKDT